MLRPLRELLRRGSLTEAYPAEHGTAPPLFRGMPSLDPALCRGHAACASICPTGAIAVEPRDAGGWSWRLDRSACVGCGLCAEVCPTGAIAISPEFELAARRREDLVTTVELVPSGADVPTPADVARSPLGSPHPDPPHATRKRVPGGDPLPEGAPTPTELRRRIAGLFRSSLHVRHLDVGSDNGADWELNATLNPLYDLQRFGIDFVASPRHADMLVVTGAVTRNLLPALLRTYEATPEPKLVMALGTDACSGGITRGSYAALGGVDRHLPVDVYVPGDPPRPPAIVHGFLLALDRREQKVRASHIRQPAGGRRAERPV
ncbi:MAG TPA: 4Fe-4S binding protein [Chloroflexota bacterium]|jgi:Ni,Fe-hydrogenase III small subunit/formate hydrogenlyase subunit 6/NADH:ubiquinone oxidoreductase subunit I